MPRFKVPIHGHWVGGKPTQEYTAWCSIKNRCYLKSHKSYNDYGGRGITVCEKWFNSFENFLADMGRKPSPEHSLDRYPDNNGNYEPGNCRWATKEEQYTNRRSNVWIEYKGIKKTKSQWAKYFGVCASNLFRDKSKPLVEVIKEKYYKINNQ